ncbi:LysR family transcriptional regulator [Rhodobacteraceae bacterium SC52]|nr:LysR family transcriptional regulator [Rhodobacteraceae bacterium SC52]
MIDQLRTMAIFQTVAELGSFRQAAKKLNLSPSVISHHITKLEADLGAPLLYRSTRRMSLTDAGVALLAASQRMTAAAIDGLSAVQRRASHPTGTLTIAASTPFSHSPYVETFTRFAQTHPDVHLSIQLEDRSIPLEGTNIDVAIRAARTTLTIAATKRANWAMWIFVSSRHPLMYKAGPRRSP